MEGRLIMMNSKLDLEKLNDVSCILSTGIPVPAADDIPDEVVETLKLARIQMETIPAALEDIEAAKREFKVLDKTIDRLEELAREASELPEEDRTGRASREAEFIKLGHVLAQIAGRQNYQGPELSIATRAKAQSSHRIIKHLLPVKESLAAQMAEQEAMVVEAVQQTIDFLEIIEKAYPQKKSLSAISDLLTRVSAIRQGLWPPFSGTSQTAGLH